MVLGIDIGGANTKVASSDGRVVEIIYLPLWKDVPLAEELSKIAERFKPRRLAVTMTGELADCFPDKRDGVQAIKRGVEAAFSDSMIRYVDVNGMLTDGIKGDELSLAAANWCASARFIAEEFEECVFVDMGSTTTDIIPIVSGIPSAHTTDFQRLLHGELVYTGMLRTSIAALTDHVHLRGRHYGLASEYFANTADLNLVRGIIGEEEYTCETPDGGGWDIASAKRRLARMLCADLEELDHGEMCEVAEELYRAQVDRIRKAIVGVAEEHSLSQIITCGIGEAVVEEVAVIAGLEITLVSEAYGKRVSSVFPAYTAARLMENVVALS